MQIMVTGAPGQLMSHAVDIKHNKQNHEQNQNQHELTYTKFLLTQTYKIHLNPN